MIVPEWQGSGLRCSLQQRLKEFAMKRRARVRGRVPIGQLRDAQPRKRLGKIEIKTENSTYHVTLLFA